MTLTSVILQSDGSTALPILVVVLFALVVARAIYYFNNRHKERFNQTTQAQPSPSQGVSCTRCGNAVDQGTKFCPECEKYLA